MLLPLKNWPQTPSRLQPRLFTAFRTLRTIGELPGFLIKPCRKWSKPGYSGHSTLRDIKTREYQNRQFWRKCIKVMASLVSFRGFEHFSHSELKVCHADVWPSTPTSETGDGQVWRHPCIWASSVLNVQKVRNPRRTKPPPNSETGESNARSWAHSGPLSDIKVVDRQEENYWPTVKRVGPPGRTVMARSWPSFGH